MLIDRHYSVTDLGSVIGTAQGALSNRRVEKMKNKGNLSMRHQKEREDRLIPIARYTSF